MTKEGKPLSEISKGSKLLDALGVVAENSEDMAIRVRARLLLVELESGDPVSHPPIVAKALPGATDESGAILNEDLVRGAVSVLRWLAKSGGEP